VSKISRGHPQLFWMYRSMYRDFSRIIFFVLRTLPGVMNAQCIPGSDCIHTADCQNICRETGKCSESRQCEKGGRHSYGFDEKCLCGNQLVEPGRFCNLDTNQSIDVEPQCQNETRCLDQCAQRYMHMLPIIFKDDRLDISWYRYECESGMMRSQLCYNSSVQGCLPKCQGMTNTDCRCGDQECLIEGPGVVWTSA